MNLPNNNITSSRKLLAVTAVLALCIAISAGCGNNKVEPASTNTNTNTNTTQNEGTPTPKIAANFFEAAGIDNQEAFLQVFNIVKAAVAADDKEKVADNILYPLRVNDKKSKSIEVKTKEELILKYDAIFTPKVKEALAGQMVEKLFVNAQGVMVGNGEVWFGATTDTPQNYGIISINLSTP